MRKGISFFFGYDIGAKERAKLIKQAGFDCVITNADTRFLFQNGTFHNQLRLFKKYGIHHSSLHMRYRQAQLTHFWEDDKIGRKLEKNIIKDIKLAHKYHFSCVVVHLLGTVSDIGMRRLYHILDVCDKYDVDIAVENIESYVCFKYVFENVQNKHLKFCYDSGHNNVWDKDVDFLTQYGDKLVALHLHDNMGNKDSHTLNKYGNIDWRNIAKKLAKIDRDIALDYEIMMYKRENETATDVANAVYKQACELEQMINEEKEKMRG